MRFQYPKTKQTGKRDTLIRCVLSIKKETQADKAAPMIGEGDLRFKG